MHTDSPFRFAAVLTALTTAALTVAALAGCGSSAGGSNGTSAASPETSARPQAAQTAAPSTAPPVAGTVNVLRVDAVDSVSSMSYRISGTPNAGLATIIFTNKGDVAHEIGLSRLKAGVTLGQIKALLLSHDPAAEQKARKLQVDPDTELGGPGILGPGLTEKVTFPLAAGHYVVTCFLPGKNGMPHVAMGMIGEFTVAGSRSAGVAPQAKGTVTLADDGITLPGGFSAGGTFEIANTGSTPHDFSVAKLAGQSLPAYFQCVGGSFGKGTPIDKCPGTLSGGVGTVQPGKSVYLTVPALPAGQYGYVSTEGNGKDFQAGLNGTFTVR